MKELFYAVAVEVKAAFRAVQVSVAAWREVCYNFVLETVRAIVAAFAVPHNVNGFIVQAQFSRFKSKLADSFLFLHPGAFLIFLLLFFPCFLFGSEAVFTGEAVSLNEPGLLGKVPSDKVSCDCPGCKAEKKEGQAVVRDEVGNSNNKVSHDEELKKVARTGFICGFIVAYILLGFVCSIHTILDKWLDFKSRGGENRR